MKGSFVSYEFEMSLEHLRRAFVEFSEAEEPYYCDWITHCKNEIQNCYDSFLKEFYPKEVKSIVKDTKHVVKEYFKKT